MTDSPAPPTEGATAGRVDVSPAALEPLIAAGERLALSDGVTGSDRHSAALELLTEVTHDLRSPLGAMLVLIGQLRDGQAGPLTRRQELQLGLLYEAAFEMSTLTQNALELARRSGSTPGLEPPVVFSIAETWQSVRALVAPIAQERGLMLRWAGPRVDRRRGHPDALQKVLLNLVTNALKFTARGAVSVTTDEHAEDRIRFRVLDTGNGLSEPARALIGELPTAQRLPSARSGRGLGLAICTRVLSAMDSRLEVGRHGGPGTCLEFDLHLPAAS